MCNGCPFSSRLLGPLCDRSDFNRCQNGGVCQEDKTGNATTCACPPKFTGRYCELPADWRLCDATSCRNNATCQLNGFGDGYECLCLPGFTGANCEVDIDECRSSPCQHSGICVDGVNDYICQCQRTGYRGRHCEENIDECVEDEPCFNGGKCQDTSGGYVCECPAGFSGRNCEKEVDECASSPCKNGGTCQNLFGRYQCLCPSGYEVRIGHRTLRFVSLVHPECGRCFRVCLNPPYIPGQRLRN